MKEKTTDRAKSKEELPMYFAKNLRKIQEAWSLSAPKLANIVKDNTTHINYVGRGTISPSSDLVIEISRMSGIDPARLLYAEITEQEIPKYPNYQMLPSVSDYGTSKFPTSRRGWAHASMNTVFEFLAELSAERAYPEPVGK